MSQEPTRTPAPLIVLMLILLVPVVLLRTLGLSAYPALHPDEGFWAAGPKNQVRFGDALLDGRLHPFLSPATFVALCGVFSFAEPNLWTARLFSAGVGI